MTRRGPVLITLVVAAMAMISLWPGASSAARPQTVTATATATAAAPPSRVLVVLFDQMLSKYADNFNMPNFRRLRDSGTNFRNAYLGYMGSETVISHNVLMSGQNPKHMGWVDEAYRDRAGLLSADRNQMWTTGELSYSQFGALVQNKGYPKLADYLRQAQPKKKFIVVGQKAYAVDSSAAESTFDTSHDDIAVKFSGRSSSAPLAGSADAACNTALGGRYRGPEGVNVPSYIKDPLCGRFYVNSSLPYGTNLAFPSWIYPLDGNRFVPGNDSAHLGGDTWVADAAIEMMGHEKWSGMFVTMGGIDKAGHMWGADSDVQSPVGSLDYQTHVQYNAENADVQLGRMLDKLKDLKQLDDTLVVLTADHGATFGTQYYGKQSPGVSATSDTNWYYGPDSKPTVYNDPSPAIQPLVATGNVQFSYQSTSIQTWLKDASSAKRSQALRVMKGLPGVIATYFRQGGRYVLEDTNAMTTPDRRWWKANAQSIIDNMADINGPDVVGLLANEVSYGAYGDHGGASEPVQRVPMVFWSSSMTGPNNSGATFKTPDVMPTILNALGIPQTYPTDGQARALN